MTKASTMLSVRLDPALAAALERHCAQTGATRSRVVQQSMAQYLVAQSGPTLGELAEALALLSTRQQFRCLEWLGDAGRAGLLEVDRGPLDFGAIEKLARRYADRPMDFADASVVLLAARTGVREILTADRRDFAVYRLAGRLRFIDVLAGRAGLR